MLTLSEAKKTGRLNEFITEQETAGIGPIDRAEFDIAIGELIKARQSEDQTSHFADGGNSNETGTRPNTDRDASR